SMWPRPLIETADHDPTVRHEPMGRIIYFFRTRSSSPMKTHSTGRRTQLARRSFVARWRLFTVALAATALLPAAASAQSGTWTATAGSPAFWDTAGNWSGGTIANGVDNTANFTSNITGPYTVALNANVDGNGGRTIGNLVFGTATNAQ